MDKETREMFTKVSKQMEEYGKMLAHFLDVQEHFERANRGIKERAVGTAEVTKAEDVSSEN